VNQYTMKPKEKCGGTWHILSPLSEKVRGTRSPCPPPNCAHACSYTRTLRFLIRTLQMCVLTHLVNLAFGSKIWLSGLNLASKINVTRGRVQALIRPCTTLRLLPRLYNEYFEEKVLGL